MQQAGTDSIGEAKRFLQQGRKDKARALLESMVSADENNLDALHLLSRIARMEGDPNRSRELLGKLLALKPDHPLYNYDLGVLELDDNQPEQALERFRKAAQAQPDNPIVLLHLAPTLETLGRRYEAAAVYQNCWNFALKQGAGLSRLPENLQQVMMQGRQRIGLESRAMLEHALSEAKKAYGNQDTARLKQLIRIVLGEEVPNVPDKQQPTSLFFPGLPDTPFLEREQFPWIEAVESNWEVIRDEFLKMTQDGQHLKPYINFDPNSPSGQHWQEVNQSLSWASCHIYEQGTLIDEVAERCPKTMAALEQAPIMHVPGFTPETMFSVLQPRTHIPPHHGAVNCRLLVHLPLIIPENCGALRVAGEARSWVPGKSLIFDDTYLHEAWNDSDETRVVLIYDIWHPGLTDIERDYFTRFDKIIREFNDAVAEPARII